MKEIVTASAACPFSSRQRPIPSPSFKTNPIAIISTLNFTPTKQSVKKVSLNTLRCNSKSGIFLYSSSTSVLLPSVSIFTTFTRGKERIYSPA